MIVIVFRTRVREDIPEEQIEPLLERMYVVASSMPGFISYKDFLAPDGENVAIVEFASLETLEAWRKHPEHKEAQRLGKSTLFAEYHVHVCTPIRSYGFPDQEGAGFQ